MSEFIDSIQTASTGESKKTHFSSGFSSFKIKFKVYTNLQVFILKIKIKDEPAQQFRITDDNIPSVHSPVPKLNSPYNSPNETALGLIVYSFKEKTDLKQISIVSL